MEVLIRWRCPCLRSPLHCPYCHGEEYFELWVAHDLVEHMVGGHDFLIRGRRPTRNGLPAVASRALPAPVQKRDTVSTGTLFIRELPPSFTIRDLEKLFAPFGSVIWSHILEKAEYAGWGHVDMATPAQAEAAMQGLDGTKIEEHSIVVMLPIHTPYAVQADRFLQLNLGKAFCELCIRAHATPSNVFPKQLLDAFKYLYDCQYFYGVCSECHKAAQVFAAHL